MRSSRGVLTPSPSNAVSRQPHQWSPGPSWVGRRASTSSAFDSQHPGDRFAASGDLDTWPLNMAYIMVLLLFQALPPQFPLEGPAAPALVLEASSVRTLGVVH